MTTTQTEDPDDLDRYVEDAIRAFSAAADIPALNQARLDHLGDRSPVALALRGVAEAWPWERSAWRQSAELARHRIAEAAVRRHGELEAGQASTRPCTRRPAGGDPVYGACPDCGHLLMLHANNGSPCAVCVLHTAAAEIRGAR